MFCRYECDANKCTHVFYFGLKRNLPNNFNSSDFNRTDEFFVKQFVNFEISCHVIPFLKFIIIIQVDTVIFWAFNLFGFHLRHYRLFGCYERCFALIFIVSVLYFRHTVSVAPMEEIQQDYKPGVGN